MMLLSTLIITDRLPLPKSSLVLAVLPHDAVSMGWHAFNVDITSVIPDCCAGDASCII